MTDAEMAGRRLSDLENLLLLAVGRLGEDAYGAAIQDELEDRAGVIPSIGTIYVTLVRLEGQGLVESEVGDPINVRGGKGKRLFSLTPRGLDALRVTRGSLQRMWDGLDDLFGPDHA